jgi:hypothetical protein
MRKLNGLRFCSTVPVYHKHLPPVVCLELFLRERLFPFALRPVRPAIVSKYGVLGIGRADRTEFLTGRLRSGFPEQLNPRRRQYVAGSFHDSERTRGVPKSQVLHGSREGTLQTRALRGKAVQ